jgi:tetratricopeptide (TPR) repeat protein
MIELIAAAAGLLGIVSLIPLIYSWKHEKRSPKEGKVLVAREVGSLHQRQYEAILAELRQLRAATLVQSMDPAEETRTEEAVRDVLTDSSPPAQEAAEAMREGRIAEAFSILRNDAAAGEAETAERWRRLGTLARGIDTAQALEAYEAAFRIHPTDFWTCIELARLRQQAGDLAGAVEATELAQKSAKTTRENSTVLNDIGILYLELGDLEESLKNFETSLEIQEILISNNPPDSEWYRGQIETRSWIEKIKADQGEFDDALKVIQANLVTIERMAASQRGSVSWDRDLSVTYGRLGEVQLAQGDLTAAQESFRASQSIAEHLVASDPGNAEWQRDLSVSHNKIGDVQVAEGNLEAALESFRASLAIAERLVAADPGNAGWQRDLSVSHERIGDVQVAQGDLAAALESFRASLAIRERLAAADPANAGWQRDLSVSHSKIGDVQVAEGNRTAALESFRAGLAIAERLAAADPGNAGWQRDLSVSHDRIGGVQVVQGNRTAALESFRAGLAIRERLAAADPGNAEWQRDLIVSYAKLAETQPGAGWWAKGLAVAEALATEGRLAPRDAWMVEDLREKAAAEAAE